MKFALWVLLSALPATANIIDKCACVTSERGSVCNLAPGTNQRAVERVKLLPKEKCDFQRCEKLYEAHRAKKSKTFFPVTCNDFVIEPEDVADSFSCEAGQKTMLMLSLTSEFDKETSVRVPPPYEPLRLDINNCNVKSIGATTSAYLAALKQKRCGCDNVVVAINSHGDGTQGPKHLTVCREATSPTVQTEINLSSRDLLLEIQSQLKANGCKNPTTAMDNCFSSKVLENLRGDEVLYPIITSAHPQCLAPGNSNLWTKYEEWCARCDTNLDGKVAISELKKCIPEGKASFHKEQYWQHHMSFVSGPWSMTVSKNVDESTPAFFCPTPAKDPAKKGPGYYHGLQGRQRIHDELEKHQ